MAEGIAYLDYLVTKLDRMEKERKFKLKPEIKQPEPGSFLARLQEVADNDAAVLVAKDRDYGSSWRKRGGMGAFMMLARKWDRIESILGRAWENPEEGLRAERYDLFAFLEFNPGDVLDDVRDLRRYLLLVEEYLVSEGRISLDVPNGRE